MFPRILLFVAIVATCCVAKPSGVRQYLGVPGNTRDDSSLHFVDLGEPIITEYKEDFVGLDIPQSPRPQAPVTLEPLLIEYSHNPINDLYKVSPKHIQVVEVTRGVETPVKGKGRRVRRQLPAGTTILQQEILNDTNQFPNNPYFKPLPTTTTTTKPKQLPTDQTERYQNNPYINPTTSIPKLLPIDENLDLNIERYQNNPFLKITTTTKPLNKRSSIRLSTNIKPLRSAYTPHRHLKIKRPIDAVQTIPVSTTTTSTTTPEPEIYDEEEIMEDVEYMQEKSKLTVDDVRKITEEAFKKQAESAKYEFSSNVDDQISGNQHNRQETRDGVNVKGSYSYSDGYFKHTVHYIADDKGYRIVKQEQLPLGDGPEYNPDGEAKVATYIAGKTLNYKVTEDDYLQHTRLGPQHEIVQAADYADEEEV